MTANYQGDSRGHTVDRIDSANAIVVLEDQSSWRVYEGFRDIIAKWKEGEMVTIKSNRDPEFPYKLVNVHHNQSVEARYEP